MTNILAAARSAVSVDATADGLLVVLAAIAVWRYALSGRGPVFHRFAAIITVLIDVWLLLGVHSAAPSRFNWEALAGIGIISFLALGLVIWAPSPPRNAEAQARQRVREAEDKLSSELRDSSPMSVEFQQQLDDALRKAAENQADETFADNVNGEVPASGTQDFDRGVLDPEIVEQLANGRAKERKDDRLTLAALWDVTHRHMDYYHEIVTGQAKRSFQAAQVAMGTGFVLLVVFAVLAADAKTSTAAISAGGLGTAGAAFAAYIGRTFIRSQETAASNLRAYFDQPLELSRYLAAERLLAGAKDLDPEKRADILSILVQSIATAGHENGNAKEAKRRGRPTRSKPA